MVDEDLILIWVIESSEKEMTEKPITEVFNTFLGIFNP
jgi:hypothetical protein